MPGKKRPSSADVQHERKVIGIYLELARYPILARLIRERMRQALFAQRIVDAEAFESEVKEKAVQSQQREGVVNPLTEEPVGVWHERLAMVRDQLTDFYFAYNLPHSCLKEIIQSVLAGRVPEYERGTALPFNPELAPWDLLFAQGEEYENLPPEERTKIQHHLREIIVVLIKGMISDRLQFVGVAKEFFTIQDLKDIRQRRIGRGKIGGKAAGMLLAWKILQRDAPELSPRITLPSSYFIGADVFYDFLALNGFQLINQKYKQPEQIRDEYPHILTAYEQGRLPEDITDRLREILSQVGQTPLIVRSSSLLEDNLGASFAGKYESYFCPNQGTPKENLRDLTLAIRRVYASVYSPDALFYRQRMGLIDYDERMAILLQEVQGETYRDYFFPTLAGVAFSYSPIVWSTRLRREDGFVRLVFGLGTRAVDRVGEDYPRLITLSHPTLRPEASVAAVKRYSQRFVDLIDRQRNALVTLPISEVLKRDYPALTWIASVICEDTLTSLRYLGLEPSPKQLVLTFNDLLQRSDFAAVIKDVLATLAREYKSPVDVEFAASVSDVYPQPQIVFHLLQCRPQSSMPKGEISRPVPDGLLDDDKLFRATRLVPQGQVSQVEYVVYVDPIAYSQIADPVVRLEVARQVGRVNHALESRQFIIIGPGRWGSSNLQLGVPVTYADIHNTRALVELAISQAGITPEPSYGTHFFQDLVEARIYPLAVYPDESGDFLNQAFISQAANHLADILPDNKHSADCIKVICIPTETDGRHMEIAMDGQQALAYFAS